MFRDIVSRFGNGDQLNDLAMDITLRAVKRHKYVFKAQKSTLSILSFSGHD